MGYSRSKPPARLTPESLNQAALFYLGRYASSSGNLRQVLLRKIQRSTRHYGDDPAPLIAAIDGVVAHYVGSGAVNDALYAETQTRKLRRRGGSGRIILQRLAAKGIPADIIAQTAPELKDASEDRAAAILFARRRRLGPFRQSARDENRQRDMAALGRAGFDYQVATAIVDTADVDALNDLIENT
jgi:regulatory protein